MKREPVTPLRVLIADDEAPARRTLRRLLEAEPDVVIVGEAADGESAVAAVLEHAPDLVLLDIQMPGLDGFEVVRSVGAERMPRLVFVSAYDEFALRAFEVNALDYVLKPLDPERFRAAVARARVHRRAGGSGDAAVSLSTVLAALRPEASYLQRILVETDSKALLLPVERITWLEAAKNYVTLYVAGGDRFTLRTSLGALQARLDPAKFLRINRSQVVQLDSVKELRPWFHGEYVVVLHDATELMWSRRFRGEGAAFEPPR